MIAGRGVLAALSRRTRHRLRDFPGVNEHRSLQSKIPSKTVHQLRTSLFGARLGFWRGTGFEGGALEWESAAFLGCVEWSR
jgi:hypothetical protein